MFLSCLYFVLYSYVWREIQSLHTYKRYLWVLVYLYTRHSFKCSVCVLLFPFYQPYKVDVTIYIVKIRKLKDQFSSVQLLSHVRLFAIPRTAARQASLFITNSQSLLKLMSIESVMPSKHLVLCRPLLLLPLVFHSIRVFSSESVFRIRWPKFWSFSFSISPSK